MKRVLLLFAFVFLYAAASFAQDAASATTVAAVKIEGNQRIATETYLYYISTKTGSAYDEQQLRDDFRRLWGTGFLSNLTILTDQTPAGIEVTFKVEEKPLVKLVEYTGNKKVSKDDIEKKLTDMNISMRIDQPFDPYVAKKITNEIEKLMVEKGLQFGTASYKTEELGGGAKVTFVVDEGPKVKIGIIEFEGNSVFPDKKLRGQMKDTKQSGTFSWITRKDDYEKEKFEKDMDRVRDYYFNDGYVNAKIDEPKIELYGEKKKHIKMTIPVQEGNQYKVGDITFEGNTVFTDEQLRPLLELKKGAVFNRGQLKKGMEEVQKIYGDQGYIYASLGPVFNPDEVQKIINVPIQVEENGQFFINHIEFTGNSYTRDKVIRREMLVQEGELLRVSRFRDSIDRIYRLGFFDDLKPNILPTEGSENRADITIDVKENKRNEIRVGGGYSEFEGFFGNVVFSTKNLFGTGKIFTVNIQGGSRYDNYGVEILEPYFLDRPISLGFSVYRSKADYYDTTVYNYIQETTGGSLTGGFNIYHDLKGLVTYAYQVVNITRPNGIIAGNDQLEELFPGYNLQQNDRTESRLIPQLVRTTINNPTDPSRGTRLLVTNVITGGILGGEVNYYKPAVSWTQYMKRFSKKHYFAYNLELAYATGFGGLPLPYYERYFLGGERSIRGYDVRFVSPVLTSPVTKLPYLAGGTKSFVANVEYVIPIGGPLKFAAFLDYGNAFLESQGIDFTDMRGSTGLEVRFLAPFLSTPFRFIYAINFNRGELMTLPPAYQPKATVFRFSVGTTF